MATAHYCPLRVTARCGGGDPRPGKPTTQKCRGCGARWAVRQGVWGVFVHSAGTGRYPLADAVATFERPSSAERYTARDPRYVVRYITT